MQNGTVTSIKSASDGQSFTITVTNSSSSSPYSVTARKLVMGTGLRDIIPDTPGVQENWGKGFYWCPWCDGHEHEDQPLGFLGPLDEVAKSVREIWNLNTDIVAFVNGTDTEEMRAAAAEETAEWQEYLKLKNVTVVNATISDIVRLKNGATGNENPSAASVEEHDLFRVDFVNDTTTQQASIERAVFFTSFKNTQASTLWSDVGMEMYKDRMLVDSSDMLSSVPGVYAVGDANSDNSTNVPHALYSGKKAAVYLHCKLECLFCCLPHHIRGSNAQQSNSANGAGKRQCRARRRRQAT
jgi:thioredoxin reductase